MNSKQALEALNALSGISVPEYGAAQVLYEHGLVISLDTQTVVRQQQETAKMVSEGDRIRRLASQLKAAITARDNVQWWLSSNTYRIASTIWNVGNDGIKQTETELETKNAKVRALGLELNTAKLEQEARIKLSHELGELVLDDGRFVRLSPLGREIKGFLEARIARVADMELDAFLDELAKVRAAVQKRIDAFVATDTALLARGFSNDSQVKQFALSVSMLPGDDLEEKLLRVTYANERIYHAGFESYDRLPIAATIAAYNGAVATICDEVFAIYEIMIADGHGTSASTLSEAAAIYGIPGGNAQEKYSRFNAMCVALGDCGWKLRSKIIGFIGARLARRTGEVVALATTHNELEKALIAAGRRDSHESGIAALILLNLPGTNDERVRKHEEALTVMSRYHYGAGKDNYATAASLTLTPGTYDENVHLLRDTEELLKKAGFKSNLMARALALIGGTYRDFVRAEHAEYVSSDSSSTTAPDDNSGALFVIAALLLMSINSNNDASSIQDCSVTMSTTDFDVADVGGVLDTIDLGTNLGGGTDFVTITGGDAGGFQSTSSSSSPDFSVT